MTIDLQKVAKSERRLALRRIENASQRTGRSRSCELACQAAHNVKETRGAAYVIYQPRTRKYFVRVLLGAGRVFDDFSRAMRYPSKTSAEKCLREIASNASRKEYMILPVQD